MTAISTAIEAAAVLKAARHRGARTWMFDQACRRVMPESWNGLDAPPSYTPWEVLTLARRLVEIGAADRLKRQNWRENDRSHLYRHDYTLSPAMGAMCLAIDPMASRAIRTRANDGAAYLRSTRFGALSRTS